MGPADSHWHAGEFSRIEEAYDPVYRIGLALVVVVLLNYISSAIYQKS